MPGATTGQRIKAVEALVHESVKTVDALAPGQLNSMLPILKQAHAELQKDLQKWLSSGPGAEDRFTAYQKTLALRALEATFKRIKDLDPAMAHALGMARHETGALAVQNLNHEIQHLSSIFGGGHVHIPQIDTAAVIAQGNKLLFKRHASSAARYAGSVGDDIRVRLSVSLAKGDTFEQMVQRLRGSPSFKQAVSMSDPAAAAHGVADAAFGRWRHWADRLVRTENMHAYNVQHDISIEHVNENRGDGEEEYLRRWDASADVITCEICKELDRTCTTLHGTFKYGYTSPPAHPYCRCVVLAWLARWGNIKGEIPSVSEPSQLGTPHDQAAEKRREASSNDQKKAAAEDLEALAQDTSKKQAWADKVAAAKAKQQQLAAKLKADLAAQKAADQAKADAAAQSAAQKFAAEQAAKAAAEKLALEKAAAEAAAKLAAEQAAIKAAEEAAAKAAQAAADALAKQAMEHAAKLAEEAIQKAEADKAAKQAKAAAAKAKKIDKLKATAAPFNPETSGVLGNVPSGKAKGKAKLLNKPGMVQVDADTIVGHGYVSKWDSNAGKWVTQTGPADAGYKWDWNLDKWVPKVTPTPTVAPVPTVGISGPKPADIKGYEWKQVNGKWVLHDAAGTPTHQLVKPYTAASTAMGVLNDTYSYAAPLAQAGLVPTGPGVMEGHGYKFAKDASGQWVKLAQAGAPYTPAAPTPTATTTISSGGAKKINGVTIPAGVSDHPSALTPMKAATFDSYSRSTAAAIVGDQRTGIYHYSTNTGYREMNGNPATGLHGLRHPPPTASAQKMVERADAAFRNPASRIPEDTIVFRGSGGKDYFSTLAEGQVFDDLGYVSTSATTNNGFYQGNDVRFHISVPKGHPAIAMNDKLSQYDNEREILLPRGQKFRILKKEIVDGRLYLHCEVLPHVLP